MKYKAIITDLDDTIWTWFDMWYQSFDNLINNISQKLDIPKDILYDNFKDLHKKYNTSESSYAFEELTCLTKDHIRYIKNEKVIDGKTIEHKYNSDRKHGLKLYDGVYDTLLSLKDKGYLLIGFTESNSFFTSQRIVNLNIDGLFDEIYTPSDLGKSPLVNPYYEKDYWDLTLTKIYKLDSSFKKPNSKILNEILLNNNLNSTDVLYIGDKINKDIKMANDCNIFSVYARYGDNSNDNKYNLLKKVSHWSEREILDEIEFNKMMQNQVVIPNMVLSNDFSEILNIL